MVTAAEYAELETAEQAAGAALSVDQDTISRNEWRKLNDAYKAAERAREAGFVAFNADLKREAVDAATAHLTADGVEEEMQLAGALVAARKVYEYAGAPKEGQLDYALRAVRIACGWEEEHHTVGLGEP